MIGIDEFRGFDFMFIKIKIAYTIFKDTTVKIYYKRFCGWNIDVKYQMLKVWNQK